MADSTTALFETEDAYVSDLLSYSLERLNKEPELLKADTDRIERHLQEVAVKHYRSFITAAECVKESTNCLKQRRFDSAYGKH
eukprot:543828-Prorocentrum_minimum.AAC.2